MTFTLNEVRSAQAKPVFEVEFELTDTFGGDRNYSWVRRETRTFSIGTSPLAIMRQLKLFAGLNGVRGRTSDYGDTGEFRPWGRALIASWRTVS